MRPFIVIVIVVIVLIGATFLVNTKDAKSTTVKIVASYPLALQSSQEIIDSLRMALEEENYTAGNLKIELVVLDDGTPDGDWDSVMEESNARKAADDSDVILYIGPLNSGASKVSMPILNRAGLTQLNVGNTWPGLTKVGYAPGEPGIFYPTGVRHYVRLHATDDLQGPAAAIWASELGFRRVYIIDDGESYGKGIADLFRDKARDLGIIVLGQETLDSSVANYISVIDRIILLKPDLIYYGGIVPNGIDRFIINLRDAGYSTRIMGPDGLTGSDLVDRVGNVYAEGVYATTVAMPIALADTDVARHYEEAFRTRFNKTPDPFSAFGYEAGKVLIDALRRAGIADRSVVLRTLRETRNFEGLFGTWSFDQNGDTSLKVLSGNVIHNGEFEFVTQLVTP